MDTNILIRKQVAKLHEKVQIKYDEMQRKLEKSKSTDMLSTLNDDYSYKEERQYVSVNDLSKIDEEVLKMPENGKKMFTRDVIAEKIYFRKNVILKEISYNEATITESASHSSLCDRSESENDDKSLESHFFGNNYLNVSMDSLNDISQGEESLPSTPPRIVRKRIGWLRGNKEKRKREKTEKLSKEKRIEEKRNSFEIVDRFILCNATKHEPLKTFKRTKIAAVTIALIEATGFDDALEEKPRILGCRFRLGSEKRKSKSVKGHDKVMKWQEIHHFNLFDDDSILEITLNDRDEFVGRTIIDLSELEKEKTHEMKIKLDYSANIKLFILLTITGTSLINSVYDMDDAVRTVETNAIRDKYAWYRLCGGFSNVGNLSVIVYGAKGLPGNDYYCVLRLNNLTVQTPTDYKTHSPSWMKIFSFTLNDITSILEVIICDEKKCEELGKVSVPLLSIENGKKWFALKENTQRERAKGNNPRILLEMDVTWNLVKASVRVINPKEVNYLQTEDKLDRHVFAKNLSRSKAVLSWVLNAFQVFRTAFEWESRKWNLIALIIWQIFCWFFKIWMLPLLLLIPFIWYRPEDYYLFNWASRYMKNVSILSRGETKQDKEEKILSLRQKITNFQETLQTVQNVLGKFASLGERFKNLFNFSVPFVSLLAIFFISVIAFVIYLVSLRYIMMGWAFHKFIRKILKPNRIPHNEVMALLSRVPDDNILLQCEELPLETISDEDES
ncbi:multiple C2 and transmembrane domain-containing protein-like [Epargyreus clarus]|uniref:multiple C2 and transmembrane domain-containing protein-like n=1 Tax=Epargyreus clarus TaxID=520877 RepID=UPI003C302C0C